jgi:ferredoxin
MPKKYHVTAQLMPPRFVPVPKYSMIEKEGCLGCLECAKRDCVYDVYKERAFYPEQMIDSIDYLCKSCLRCIQGCKNELITKMKNPDFDALGDDYWKPDIIATLWEQATNGKIPVSGAGYRGPFSGPGFDSMWTDMSEIVRPTRDGIHGREYINTGVNIGRSLMQLEFDADGELYCDTHPQVELPIPIIFDKLPFGVMNADVRTAFIRAAEMVGAMVVVPEDEIDWKLTSHIDSIIPLLLSFANLEDDRIKEIVGRARMVELNDRPDIMKRIQKIKDFHPATIVSIRVPAGKTVAERVEWLTREGAEVIHLVADWQGSSRGDDGSTDSDPMFIKDMLREVHLNLIDKAMRDEVTIIASGGIAMAEHVAKAVICGANLVGIDIALEVALECRVCKRCARGLSCPVSIETIDPEWGALRIRNLICAWHSQLIEVLGAMGLREVRRLRGEVGRAMFYEDLEQEAFGDVKVAPDDYR